MRYRDLTEEQMQDIWASIWFSMIDEIKHNLSPELKEHVEKCKHCTKYIETSCTTLTNFQLTEKVRNLHDETIEYIASHGGAPLPKHCSLPQYAKECKCLKHALDEKHCCICEKEHCIQPMKK